MANYARSGIPWAGVFMQKVRSHVHFSIRAQPEATPEPEPMVLSSLTIAQACFAATANARRG